jgi:hypothetical protein
VVSIHSEKKSGAPAVPKQLRLEFGKEYVFDDGHATVRIQPGREGIYILPEKRMTG